MIPDDNESISFFLSPETLPKSILITNLSESTPLKHIKFLFSKSGVIESIFKSANSLILTFSRQSSVELALIYDNYKFDFNSSEIKVRRLKEVLRKEITTSHGDSWKELKETPQNPLKPKEFKSLNELNSLRSSYITNPDDSLENAHSKLVKRTLVKDFLNENPKEDEGITWKFLKKYENNKKLSLSVIKEDALFAEKTLSPTAKTCGKFSQNNKENVFNIKMMKASSSIENIVDNSNKLMKESYKNTGNMRKTSNDLRKSEENSLKYTSAAISNAEIFEEPTEKIFQPLKNVKTSIGKYYKYQDIVRDYAFSSDFINFVLKIWMSFYIIQFICENFVYFS